MNIIAIDIGNTNITVDLDPDGEIVKKLRKKIKHRIYTISAVTDAGIKDLCELLWKKVKKEKS